MVQKTNWHTMDVDECLEQLNTSPSGLTEEDVSSRQSTDGKNELLVAEHVSWLTLFLNQFKDFMVLVLLAATLISGLLGEYTDAITIIAIIFVNGVLGFLQEVRAERSLASLKQLTAPMAAVLRDGQQVSIKASELVPGDIVFLEAGDRVPADMRLVQVSGLEVEESSLTGESLPVSKHAGKLDEAEVSLGDRRNLAYMGTMVTRGKAVALVVETGMQTEMGLIADLIASSEDTETPLQRRLDQLGKLLVYISLGITVVVVVTGYLHGHELGEMFLAGVSLAVAAIPEGLPAIVTIALALGVQRMIRRKAIVRKLPSVETLGCATVICSDKTGTLTQNRMTVQRIYQAGRFYGVTGTGYQPHGEIVQSDTESPIQVRALPDLARLLEIAVLCNNSVLQETQAAGAGSIWSALGDPTEAALHVLARKANLDAAKLASLEIRLDEIPFDSERKMMSVVTRKKTGEIQLLTKGAPDVVLDRCTHILVDQKQIVLSAVMRRMILRAIEEMGAEALRNLAFAYKSISNLNISAQSDPENGLVFVGVVGMIDPPRAEVFEAVQICKHAGIRTVMITGDHQVTALAIARQLGILPNQGLLLTGAEISSMSQDDLIKRVDNTYVFARVSPENKLQIVKALQARGHVVAMTGDGVNDAPAIKASDIGIAMGLGGTDVAKDASALILSDDNFATIVAAIEEGRAIYDNIRKFV
ncbi:MAG: ATPase, partial [Bacilli bacterium]|nr:ATPase [Bacilli bacterium]